MTVSLDRQYNARASVSDAEMFLARRRAWSADARARFPHVADVAYGPHSRQRLDLFMPPTSHGVPVVVYFHGGYWHSNAKEHSSYVAGSLVPNGIAAAIVGYPLLPDATMDDLVASARKAVTFLHRDAGSLGLDKDRIFVAGHSSGAHLAAMVAAAGWQRTLEVPRDVIKGGCLLSGLYDLGPLRRTYVNEWVQLTPSSARRNSPIHHLPAQDCRVAVLFGEMETDGFRRQSVAYADVCRERGIDTSLIQLDATNHFQTPEGLADAGSRVATVIREMVAATAR